MPAAPDTVFAIVGDLSRDVELSGSGEVRALRQVGAGAVDVGTRFEADEQIRVVGCTTRMVASSEVVEFDPPNVVSRTSMPSVPPKAAPDPVVVPAHGRGHVHARGA